MARSITLILRDIDYIKKHDELNAAQKAHAMTKLREELDQATGQGTLIGQAPPEPPASGTSKAKT